MNFKSKAAYQKWLAYGHMHGDFERTPGDQPVSIRGKKHKVKHSSNSMPKSAAMIKRMMGDPREGTAADKREDARKRK